MRLPLLGLARHTAATGLCVLLAIGVAAAEPLTFGNVEAIWSRDGILHRVDLFGPPDPVLVGTVIESEGVRRAFVSFSVPIFGTLAPGETDTVRLTFGLPPGDRPLSRTVQELTFTSELMPNSILGGMDYPRLYSPQTMTLTVDLLRSSPDFRIPGGPRAGELADTWTYSFSVVQPVPEPSTLLLVGSGLGAIVAARRRRARTASTSASAARIDSLPDS